MVNAYPLRLKGIHCTNAPSTFEAIFNLVKSFMNEKMKKRMSLYSTSNSEKVFQHIPKKMLPKELGGDNESIEVLAG
ncbi:hypothetical protein ILUMI_00110 [Ignelater luminosus]|uniref:CRAL-TRIO domain-containing protein n=1 Tax=Ignelater luminosus TaxID=2038154 RepID=A0A8K0DMI6_IGNLU|nr:hypothetical protein ILUMI_00110 [Ignelater luminosus]